MSTIGNVAVAKNSGADVGVRREINIIEGANMAIGVVDDPANHRVNLTFVSAGATATAWTSQFFPAVNPNSNKGLYSTLVMEDETIATIRQTFYMPDNLATIEGTYVIIIPNASGNIYWGADTNFAEVCADEDYQTHVDTIALNAVAVTADEVECLDISAALTGAIGGDIVGIEFVRDSEDALDTVDADVHYLGILIRGNA